MKIIELTKDNESKYLNQIAKLEEIALKTIEEDGREGQLFATGRDDISKYVHSEENTVLVAIDKERTSSWSNLCNTRTETFYI